MRRLARLHRATLLATALVLGTMRSAFAAECDSISKGFTPLEDLAAGTYQGFEAGLYPGGAGAPPFAHFTAGVTRAHQIEPLDAAGAPDAQNGWIVLLSIGMSNTSQEFGAFLNLANGYAGKNPRLRLVNGAQGGATALRISNPNDVFWSNIDVMLANANLTAAQVQAIWLKEANAAPTEGFPQHAVTLQGQLATVLGILHDRYPNARLCYLSSRIYAGYASTALNPEPYAYESGFAVKWLVEAQIHGDPALNFDAALGPVEAPWIAWGPYMWADGLVPRSDGLTWACGDFAADGTHPSEIGRAKVADQLLAFFTTDATARPWFLANPTAVGEGPAGDGIALHAALPNPFRSRTAIRIDLARARPVVIEIVTPAGRRLATLADATLGPGTWRFEWDGADAAGRPVGAGVYFLRLRSLPDLETVRKLTLLR